VTVTMIVKKALIVLLDKVTNHIDNITAQRVQSAIMPFIDIERDFSCDTICSLLLFKQQSSQDVETAKKVFLRH